MKRRLSAILHSLQKRTGLLKSVFKMKDTKYILEVFI